jgi:hypothetical protein
MADSIQTLIMYLGLLAYLKLGHLNKIRLVKQRTCGIFQLICTIYECRKLIVKGSPHQRLSMFRVLNAVLQPEFEERKTFPHLNLNFPVDTMSE